MVAAQTSVTTLSAYSTIYGFIEAVAVDVVVVVYILTKAVVDLFFFFWTFPLSTQAHSSNT